MAIDWAKQLKLNELEAQHGLPSGLLSAVLNTESAGDPNATSPKGARGLFQFMPETAQSYGIDPLDPVQAARGAAQMYSDLNKQYKGDLPSMLAAYNWGSGNLARNGIDNAPKETRDYIAKITQAMQPPAMPSVQVAQGGPVMNDASPDMMRGPISFDDLPDAPGAAVKPTATAGISFDDLPDEPAAAPPPKSGLDKALMYGRAAARGATTIATGIPDIGASIPILADNLMSEDRKWSDGLFPITNYVFDKAGAAADALGIPNPQPEGFKERAISNALEFGVGMLGPAGIERAVAKGAKAIAPAVNVFAPATAAKLANPIESFPRAFRDVAIADEAFARAAQNPSTIGAAVDALKPSGAQLASGAGAGTAVTIAQDQMPADASEGRQILTNLGAAFLGAKAGPTAARIVASPRKAFGSLKDAVTLEPNFKASPDSLDLPPNTDTVNKAARVFQTFSGNPSRDIANLDKNMPAFANDSVQNLTSNLAESPGLTRLARGFRQSKDPRIGTQYIERDQALASQNINDFKKLAPAETGNTQKTLDELQGQTEQVRATQTARAQSADELLRQQERAAADELARANIRKEKYVAGRESQVDTARQQLEQQKAANRNLAQEISVTPRASREAAGSELVTDVLEPAKAAERAQYKKMIAPFENDNVTQIDTTAGHEAAQALRDDMAVAPFGAADPILNRVINKLMPLDAEGNILPGISTPKELLALEQRVNAAARTAAANGDGAAVDALGKARDGIRAVLDEANLGDDYAAARGFYREKIAQPFTQGTTGKVLKSGPRGEDYAGAIGESVSKYLQAGPKGGESMDQLLRGAPREQIIPKIRDSFVDDMFKQHYDPQTSKFNTAAIRKYMADRPEAFDRVPELRTEMRSILNRLDDGKTLEDMASQSIREAKDAARGAKVQGARYMASRTGAVNETLDRMRAQVAQVKRDADAAIRAEEQSAVKYFLDVSEPKVAIERVMSDRGNLTKNLVELRKRASLDKSGKALNGLKEGIYDFLEERMTGSNLALGRGEAPLDFNKTRKTMAEYRDALLKSGIYTPEDAQVLDLIQKRLETSQRGNLRVTNASDTAENQALSDAQKALARSGLRFVYGGFRGGVVYSILLDSLQSLAGLEAKNRAASAIVDRALLDPTLGRALLARKLSPEQISTFQAQVNRILDRRTTIAGTQTDDKDEKPPTK